MIKGIYFNISQYLFPRFFTSKIGTNSSALKVALSKSFDGLVSLGQMDIGDEIVTLVEKFLVRCICKDENINTFEQLRNMVYYKKSKKLDLERFPQTSSSIFLHIRRAHLQSHVWLSSPFSKSFVIDSLEYGYNLQEDDDDDDEVMKPNIMTISLPDNLPIPCKCGKCARAHLCISRVNNIQCCQHCNCKAETCQNSYSNLYFLYRDFMLGLFDCMNYCFLIKTLLKDISVSSSSLSSIPTSKTCNFFQRHFYTVRLKLFLISSNFVID